MYLPQHFAQTDPRALQAPMAQHPLATLVTLAADGVTADHLPLEFSADTAPHGTLRGHVARANTLWRHADGATVLAVFCGPQAYVSPNWYPTKAATHKVVPTWNYAVVHAHGVLRTVDEAAWLRALVGRLTQQHEHAQARPWSIEEAPADYIEQMLGAIIGVEIALTRLVGKWKGGLPSSTRWTPPRWRQ